MRLYTMAGTCALSVHIALEWSGLDYGVDVLRRGDQHKPDYLAVNPMGSVPALRLSKDRILTEDSALLTYVDALLPGRFSPGDGPEQRARLAQLLSFLTTEVHAAFGPHFVPERFHPAVAEHDAVRSSAYRRLERLLDLLNARFAGPYFFGEHQSVGDPYVFVITRWIGSTPLKLADYPTLHKFNTAMSRDESVRDCLAAYG